MPLQPDMSPSSYPKRVSISLSLSLSRSLTHIYSIEGKVDPKEELAALQEDEESQIITHPVLQAINDKYQQKLGTIIISNSQSKQQPTLQLTLTLTPTLTLTLTLGFALAPTLTVSF